MDVRVVLLLLFVVCLLFTSIRTDEAPCNQQSVCVCTFTNGSSIDLTPLDDNGLPQ